MSNVKPGDLAYIVHPSLYGKFVNVLYATPISDGFILPDGVKGFNTHPGMWICEAHGALFDAPYHFSDGTVGTRKARFSSIGDHWLRPIRGLDAADEAQAGKPKSNVMAPRRQVEFAR